MILRDRCSTSYDLASLFRGRRNAVNRPGGVEKSQNALVRGRLMSSSLKSEEISQNCPVFDVVKFKN